MSERSELLVKSLLHPVWLQSHRYRSLPFVDKAVSAAEGSPWASDMVGPEGPEPAPDNRLSEAGSHPKSEGSSTVETEFARSFVAGPRLDRIDEVNLANLYSAWPVPVSMAVRLLRRKLLN